MKKIQNKSFDVGYMDTLAGGDTYLHSLDPRAKLITTLIFIVMVVSFNKYTLSALAPFLIYPVILIVAGDLPVWYLAKKLLIVAPFAVFVGIFNPVIDKNIVLYIGSIGITGGWVSFLSILMRFMLTVSAALILVSLTGFNAVCESLSKLGIPGPFIVQLQFFYRYMFVLIDEAERMLRARSLRKFKAGTMGFGLFISLVGNLLVRTLDRAERIYMAMCCRGFDGNIHVLNSMKFGRKEIVFTAGWSVLFVIFRCINIPLKTGALITGLLK